MGAFDELSVLVVSWNQAERLGRCLEAVRRFLPGAQVVVVDNGSVPRLQVQADVVVRLEQNVGYAEGNNQGWAQCTGRYVLLLNNDAYLPSSEPLLTLLNFLEAHPEVSAAQAKMVLPDGRLDACGEMLNWNGLLRHRGYREVDCGQMATAVPVFAGKGACLLLRKAAVAKAGGLFRKAFFCYYEDIDLCHRLWLSGGEVWFVPTEAVLHEEKATSRLHPSRQVWRQYLTNMLTSALDLWDAHLWLTRGVPFLICLLGGSLLHGVLPRLHRHHVPFGRVRTSRDVLNRLIG